MTDLSETPKEVEIDADPSFAEVVAGVRDCFDSGRSRPVAWRESQLDALLLMLKQHQSELIGAIQEDLGRPVAEAFGADIGHATLAIKHLRKHTKSWAKPTKVFPGVMSLPGKAEIVPEPLGVALVIAPWNYPIQLLIEPMAAAIAAGNCVVAKPSELAPASAAVLARLLPQYLDDEAIVVVEGGVPETTALLTERFDHIFFTGSTNVGRIVMRAAAEHLTPVTLELGGKSPTVVLADADIEIAARRIAWAKFMNAGQTCIAPDYVLVEESIKDEFVSELSSAIDSFYGQDPSTSKDFARIVSESHLSRLKKLLASSGGVVAAGGAVNPDGRYVAPTVVVDPDLSAPIMEEEIFGPVLPIVGVESASAAVAFINAREKPLALYVFTDSSDAADSVIENTSSGGVCVNHAVVHILPENLPFGGVGQSGMGSYHGKYGFDAFSHLKPVMRRPFRPDPPLTYPPYDAWKEKVLKLVFK